MMFQLMNGMNVCSWRASALLHMPLALRQARATEKLDMDSLPLKDREPLGDKCPDLFDSPFPPFPQAQEVWIMWIRTKVWPDPRWSKTQFLTPATFHSRSLKALAFVELQFCFLYYLVFSFCRMLIFIDRDEKWILSSPLLHTWNMQGAFIEFSGRESTFWIYFLGTGFRLGLTGFWCGKRIYLQLVLTGFCIDLYLQLIYL